MGEVLGLVILLAVAGVALIAILTAVIAFEARRPPRHTAGYAVAKGLPVDPGELGLSYEAWPLDRPGGINLPVWEIELAARLDDDARAALTAVLVHGWGQSRIDMLARIASWRGRVGRVVAYDLRGHGDSEGLSDLGAGEAGDLLALLERLGEGPVVLVGCSMGAVVAIEAAAREGGPSDRIVGIVAYGPYTDFHASLRGRLRRSGVPVRPMTDLAMLWFRLRGLRHRAVLPLVERLRCPLLIFHGAHDEICPPEHGRRLAAAAPHAQLVEVPGAAHLDAAEVDPDGHDRHLRAFLAALSA